MARSFHVASSSASDSHWTSTSHPPVFLILEVDTCHQTPCKYQDAKEFGLSPCQIVSTPSELLWLRIIAITTLDPVNGSPALDFTVPFHAPSGTIPGGVFIAAFQPSLSKLCDPLKLFVYC
ncbi:hypothetical protein OIU77_029544 [Salix suchowensis]|uniref:Uncharacterized protein n=1 Tax=Salix suchowensis TaxID=1278906 RepID=A0ABQ9BC32_9ROSI|nr:hypothetical protein OIU77_029544 [Salix suchowensis]